MNTSTFFIFNIVVIIIRAALVMLTLNFLLASLDASLSIKFIEAFALCFIFQILNFTPETFRLLLISEQNGKISRSTEAMTGMVLALLIPEKSKNKSNEKNSRDANRKDIT